MVIILYLVGSRNRREGKREGRDVLSTNWHSLERTQFCPLLVDNITFESLVLLNVIYISILIKLRGVEFGGQM